MGDNFIRSPLIDENVNKQNYDIPSIIILKLPVVLRYISF